MEEDENVTTPFLLNIPPADILFSHIFSRLSPKDLFNLRSVNKKLQQLITEYFKVNRTLDLSSVHRSVTMSAFEIFTANAVNLRYLDLCSCKCLGSQALDPVLRENEKIYHLNISHCFSVSNSSLDYLGPALKVLNLSNCHWLSAQGLMTIAWNCRNLEQVDLTSCWEVTDEAVCHLANLSRGLKNLSVSRIYGITDISLVLMSHTLTNLETLNLTGCWRITDYGIRLVGEYCNQLKWLKVEDCRSVTEHSLTPLRPRIHIDRLTTDFNPPFPRLHLQI